MKRERLSVDVAIVGAGPAGLSAARAAATSGATIAIVDDNPRAGGQIWRHGASAAAALAPAAAERLAVLRQPNVAHLAATRIVGETQPGTLLLEDDERGFLLDYRTLILCCGARELLLPFPGWTLPGVTGAGGLQALIKYGVDVRGQRTVIAGSGPLLLASAATARAAGARVSHVLEQAAWRDVAGFGATLWRWPSKLAQAAKLVTGAYRPDAYVVEAFGDKRLERVRIRHGEREFDVDCDRLACGFGLVPNTVLPSHLGCRIDDGAVAVDAHQRTSRDGCFAAGECTGVGGSELAMVEGEIAGYAATAQTAPLAALVERRAHWQAFADGGARALRAARADPAARATRHAAVPLRGRTFRRGRAGARLDGREAAVALRDGRVSGTRVRCGCARAVRLDAAGAAHAARARAGRYVDAGWCGMLRRAVMARGAAFGGAACQARASGLGVGAR